MAAISTSLAEISPPATNPKKRNHEIDLTCRDVFEQKRPRLLPQCRQEAEVHAYDLWKKKWGIPEDLSNLKMLGRGAFGTAYEVQTPEGLLALKIISPKEREDLIPHQFKRRTFQGIYKIELKNFKRLQGKNIVNFPTLFSENSRPPCRCLDNKHLGFEIAYFMTRAPGITLIEKALSSLYKVQQLSIGLFKTLEQLHNLGLLYCDLKPENYLWDDENNQVMLVDMGSIFSKKCHVNFLKKVCTPTYQPPETLIDSTGSLMRGVLFTFGCTIFEAATGLPLANFYTEDLNERNLCYRYRLIEPKSVDVDTIPPYWPIDLESATTHWRVSEDHRYSFVGFLDGLLAFDPKERFENPTTVLADPFCTLSLTEERKEETV